MLRKVCWFVFWYVFNYDKSYLSTFCIKSLDKLIALGSDGASNMTGVKGLAALLRRDVNPELVNVHCFAHKLELAFWDVLKKSKVYDKLMTLLTGLYYFYTKHYKNKHGLQRSIPSKVTGTRWLAHLSKRIKSLLWTYLAYEAHLSTLSHSNPKAEGYLKMLLSNDLVCFILFLQVNSIKWRSNFKQIQISFFIFRLKQQH